MNQHPFYSVEYWSFEPICAKKIGVVSTGGSSGTTLDYGVVCYPGDKVGVLVEYKRGEASISFFKNGMFLGEAFSGIKSPLCPALSMFTGSKQVTIDPKAIMPQYGMFSGR